MSTRSTRDRGENAPDLLWLVLNSTNCGISLRNLCLFDPKAPKIIIPSSKILIYSLGSEDTNYANRRVLLSSTVTKCTSNPTWTFSGMAAPSSMENIALLDVKQIVLCVTHHPQAQEDSEDICLLEEIIDLSRLIPLQVSRERQNFPLNFMYLVIEDSLYTTESMYLRMQSHSPRQFPNLRDNEQFDNSISMSTKSISSQGNNVAATIPQYFRIEDDASNGPLSSTRDEILSVESESTNLREQIESIWSHTVAAAAPAIDSISGVEAVNKQRLISLRAQKLAKIAALKEAILAEETARNDELQQIQFQEQELHRIRSQQLPSAIERLSQLSERLQEQMTQLQQQRVELTKVRFLHEARQVKLLSELQSIYPIDPGHREAPLSSNSNNNVNTNNNIGANTTNSLSSSSAAADAIGTGSSASWGGGWSPSAIRGIELVWGGKDLLCSGPGNNAVLRHSSEDELVAAGLSYVAHLLILASKYLAVPLRYQIIFMGSRSMIRDIVSSNSAHSTLPLHRRNVERDRFERALLWLRRDVEQLLSSRGVQFDPAMDLLANLHQLFVCEMCPRIAM